SIEEHAMRAAAPPTSGNVTTGVDRVSRAIRASECAQVGETVLPKESVRDWRGKKRGQFQGAHDLTLIVDGASAAVREAWECAQVLHTVLIGVQERVSNLTACVV